ncbi:hypothetical protein BH23VER1_BH23VER1_23180 [soil metagenome]
MAVAPADRPVSDAPDSDRIEVELGLAPLLLPLPEAALGFDPAKVPDHVTTRIPLAIIKPQLASGRISVPLGMIIDGCEERFQPAFAKADREADVRLPLQDVFHSLPEGALAPTTSKSPDPEAGSHGRGGQVTEFQTPFSVQAEQDANTNPFPPAPAPANQPPPSASPFGAAPPSTSPASPFASASPFAAGQTSPPESSPSPFGSPVSATSSEPVGGRPPLEPTIDSPLTSLSGSAMDDVPPPIPGSDTQDTATAGDTGRTAQPPATPAPSPFGLPPDTSPSPAPESKPQSNADPEPQAEAPFDPFAPPKPRAEPIPSDQSPFGQPAAAPAPKPTSFSPFDSPPSAKPAGPASEPAPPLFEDSSEPPPPSAPAPEAAPFPSARPLSPLPELGLGFRLTPPHLGTPADGLASNDLLEDLDDLETLPDPAAATAPAPAPQQPDDHGSEDLTFGYADDAPGQLALRAVFATDEPVTPQRAVELSAQLPGIAACLFLDGSDDGAIVGGNLDDKSGQALRNAPELYRNVRALAQMMGVGEDATTFTIRTGGGILSFFTEDDACLGIVHASGGFQPGVREKLTLVARELGAMTTSAAAR